MESKRFFLIFFFFIFSDVFIAGGGPINYSQISRIEIHRKTSGGGGRISRQCLRYITPTDYLAASTAEILVVDECAAIPLPTVRKLVFGNKASNDSSSSSAASVSGRLCFLSSTVHGYEGTGRSLSLKLLNDLRKGSLKGGASRQLTELSLQWPIRYSLNDPVEKWLNVLLCLPEDFDEVLGGKTKKKTSFSSG
jgi:tRNA(Met) C34 N-acetyltransferase TmcA